MLEASVTAIKAQYFELLNGVDLATGARRRADKAIDDLGILADREAKLFAASAAADNFIKEEAGYRHEIDRLTKAMNALGRKYAGKANPYL